MLTKSDRIAISIFVLLIAFCIYLFAYGIASHLWFYYVVGPLGIGIQITNIVRVVILANSKKRSFKE